MSITKKGLIIGLCIGIIFGIYSNITGCHTSPGGPNGCSNSFQLFVAGVEFILWIIPVLLFKLVPGIIDTESMSGFKIILFIGPIVVFSLLGLLIGFLLNRKYNKT